MELKELIITQERRVKNISNSFRMTRGITKQIDSAKLSAARRTLSELKLLNIDNVMPCLTDEDKESVCIDYTEKITEKTNYKDSPIHLEYAFKAGIDYLQKFINKA